jgi:hypothetical protein
MVRDLKTGKGSVSTDGGVLSKTLYLFGIRFENGSGTNPEELIAAAYDGCLPRLGTVNRPVARRTRTGWAVAGWCL